MPSLAQRMLLRDDLGGTSKLAQVHDNVRIKDGGNRRKKSRICDQVFFGAYRNEPRKKTY